MNGKAWHDKHKSFNPNNFVDMELMYHYTLNTKTLKTPTKMEKKKKKILYFFLHFLDETNTNPSFKGQRTFKIIFIFLGLFLWKEKVNECPKSISLENFYRKKKQLICLYIYILYFPWMWYQNILKIDHLQMPLTGNACFYYHAPLVR